MPHQRVDKEGRLRHGYRFDATPEEHALLNRIRLRKEITIRQLFKEILVWLDRGEDSTSLEVTLAVDYVTAAALDRWDLIPDYLRPSEADRERLDMAVNGLVQLRQRQAVRKVLREAEGQQSR